jgi:hypothetical protein
MRNSFLALGISACFAMTVAALPAAADAGKTEAVHPSGGSVSPMTAFSWLVSKNADKYDIEIFDRNGKVLQSQTVTSANAKCNSKKTQVCRSPIGPVDEKAVSWRVRGVDGSKKGPFSDLSYFVVETSGPLWAVVNPDISLARGSGVVSVSKENNGKVAVVFFKDVSQCAYTANVGFAGDVGSAPDGAVTVVGLNQQPNGVYVSTYNQEGVPTDSGFHLLVTCSTGNAVPVLE